MLTIRVLTIQMPTQRVVEDVLAYRLQLALIAYDAVVKPPLPQPTRIRWPAPRCHTRSIEMRRVRLEPPRHRGDGYAPSRTAPIDTAHVLVQNEDAVEMVRHRYMGVKRYPAIERLEILPDGVDHLAGGRELHLGANDLPEQRHPLFEAESDKVGACLCIVVVLQASRPANGIAGHWSGRIVAQACGSRPGWRASGPVNIKSLRSGASPGGSGPEPRTLRG